MFSIYTRVAGTCANTTNQMSDILQCPINNKIIMYSSCMNTIVMYFLCNKHLYNLGECNNQHDNSEFLQD